MMNNIFDNIIIRNDYDKNISKYEEIVKYKQRPYVFGYVRLSRDDDKEQNSLNDYPTESDDLK